jgi:Ran-binding protein 9/10
VIQHLILDGRTTDAIDKTKELFPSLLNDKNLLFTLKVRQFIEMINGTESEMTHSSAPSTVTLCPTSSSSRSSSSHVHSNGTQNISTHRRASTSNQLTTVNSLSSTNSAGMEIDIDDTNHPANGFNHDHQISPSHSSTLVNGHHQMDVESHSSELSSKENNQLLARILQFGRELHALKQQLTNDCGENSQNEKMLQVNPWSLTIRSARKSLVF